MKLVDYIQAMKKDCNTIQLKREFDKACYEVYDQMKGRRQLLEKIAEEQGVSVSTIYRHARDYMKEVLKMSDDEYREKYVIPSLATIPKKKIKNTPFNSLLLKLMKEENPTNIIEQIQNSGVNLKLLVNSEISDFVHSYFPEPNDNLIENLNKKIKIYKQWQKEQQLQNTLKLQEEILYQKQQEEQIYYENEKFRLREYIEGTYDTKEQYCQINHFSLSNFDRLIKFAEEHDLEQYQKYDEKRQLEKQTQTAYFTEIAKNLILLIGNGIKCENSTERPFDIIDFYEFAKLDFNAFGKILSSLPLTKEEFKIMKTFLSKNKNNIYVDLKEIERVLASVQEIHCQKDKNGSLIPGTGRVIELSEKENIIDFLNQAQVPLNQRTYTIAFRRYVNGTLFKQQPYSKVKKQNI